MGIETPIAAVALGACIVEKHFTLSRNDPGPDSSFSMEPDEFQSMVSSIRSAQKAVGNLSYTLSKNQKISRAFRRSLFVADDIKSGEKFTEKNVRSVRPAYGLHPRYLYEVIGRTARTDIARGTPLKWELIGE